MDHFHRPQWAERIPLVGQLADERLRSLGQRLIYVEAPDVMTEEALRDYATAIARRLMAEDDTVPWLTYPRAIAEADELLANVDPSETALLTGLRHYLRDRADDALALAGQNHPSS